MVEYVDPADGQEYAVPQVTRHIHAGLTIVEEYNVTADGIGGYLNDRLREFLWGDQFPEPLAMIDRTSDGAVGAGSDEVFHYLRGDLGSVIGLTNADGVLVERYVYDPYGQTYIEKPDGQGGWTFTDGQGQPFAASSLGNPWMWTGQRYDAGVKLYHFLFRGYSPHLGRWLQRDPVGYIDGPNLYEYVAGNPLFWIDPLGLNVALCGPSSPGPPWVDEEWPDSVTLPRIPRLPRPSAPWVDNTANWGDLAGVSVIGGVTTFTRTALTPGGLLIAGEAGIAGTVAGAVGYSLWAIVGLVTDIKHYLDELQEQEDIDLFKRRQYPGTWPPGTPSPPEEIEIPCGPHFC